jgi:ATP-dependent helicase Lhr and Lhr-like helicase
MTTPSVPSNSEPDCQTFDLLHPEVQRWVWAKGWTSLRNIQARAIAAILGSKHDVLITASTAAGKTEAAFLPILTEIANIPGPGIKAMYVGPLKALINDQFLRLEELCATLHIPVAKWHGDASQSMKRRAREKPDGVLLITPESIEALFVRRPGTVKTMFESLRFVVIDELHAFLDTERGVQLASLLKRIDASCGVHPRRIGLSATIADLNLAAEWLRPDAPKTVSTLESTATGAELKLQLRGIVRPSVAKPDEKDDTEADGEEEGDAPTSATLIAEHLFKVLRAQGNHLVFAGSRGLTETLADRLRVLSEKAGVPNEFFPHHGSLSRDMREALEGRLKDGNLPTTAIATTTLELGIDIGSVKSIAQIGAPASVSSLRQRLGRSGRREGEPAILRMYVTEAPLHARSAIEDRLRLETIQAIAVIRLLLAKKMEPPNRTALHLSTLLHQTLSIILQRGGVRPNDAFALLSGAGPFEVVDEHLYVDVLRAMRATDPPLIEQAPDGTLMLGPLGERIASNYDFYSVFITADEFAIIHNGKTLGTLSILNALGPGDFIIFGGRRWRVREVDSQTRKVFVEPAPAGRVPLFGGDPAPLHDLIVEEMRRVYLDKDEPVYLDVVAKRHLAEGRAAFRELGLDRQSWIATGSQIYLFPWKGTRLLDALRLALRRWRLDVTMQRCCVVVDTADVERVFAALEDLVQSPPNPQILAAMDDNLCSAKYDYLLPKELLRKATIANKLDMATLSSACLAILPIKAAISEATPFGVQRDAY